VNIEMACPRYFAFGVFELGNPHHKMFKWQLQSAVGRGRPLAHDVARVADGITAGLRQFSIAVQRCEGMAIDFLSFFATGCAL
jgi:hypothetical protein